MSDKVPQLLLALAVEIESQILAVGGNPRDPSEVDSFVNGCGFSKKLKRLIVETLDEE